MTFPFGAVSPFEELFNLVDADGIGLKTYLFREEKIEISLQKMLYNPF